MKIFKKYPILATHPEVFKTTVVKCFAWTPYRAVIKKIFYKKVLPFLYEIARFSDINIDENNILKIIACDEDTELDIFTMNIKNYNDIDKILIECKNLL